MNSAELVMNIPELRSLILNYRTDAMALDHHKKKMRSILKHIPQKKIVNDEYTCFDATDIDKSFGYYGPPEYMCYAYDRRKLKTYICLLTMQGWEFNRTID